MVTTAIILAIPAWQPAFLILLIKLADGLSIIHILVIKNCELAVITIIAILTQILVVTTYQLTAQRRRRSLVDYKISSEVFSSHVTKSVGGIARSSLFPYILNRRHLLEVITRPT